MPHEVTELLSQVRRGEARAIDRLLPLVYDELRRLAAAHLRTERNDHTLQATALAHEAYVRLVGDRKVGEGDRSQFFAAASSAIRRILVDHARKRSRQKRGGKRNKLSLEVVDEQGAESPVDLVMLDDLLERLSQTSDRKARVVELRFFGGLSNPEIAEVLGVTTRSIERDWQFAKAWLFRELSESQQA